ncbi:hypothetical protein GYMLUDRAFT_179961 [Collybiopsis luxurians FD-317 M1]|uniref:Uncharacterized protein n=1 Tax=Collybiopsis luxurians FD-317 M1 TaxID=944289 RepID=A0A0D0BDJ8_9AGAR|nr:hypothetical protein GYMLUDRAFT_179961 [Collybiopsis luxurians FD-317 M1]
MLEVCRAAGDEEGVSFWQWVLHLLDCAGHELMSDEEDITMVDKSIPGRVMTTPAKEVLVLKWRHTYLTKLFTFIDVTTGVEDMVFQRAGHSSLQRLCGGKESNWLPLTGCPKSFFNLLYLAKLTIPQKSALRMDESEFILRNFEGYLDG